MMIEETPEARDLIVPATSGPDLVPTTVASLLPNQRKIRLNGKDIRCRTSSRGILLVPDVFLKSPALEKAVPALEQLIMSGEPEAFAHPWILGSTNLAIDGRSRDDSQSHLLGLAFDISPCYSDDEVIDPQGSVLGLAWNLVSLSILSSWQDRALSWVVEGDHVHCQFGGRPTQLPLGWVISVATLSSWYRLASKVVKTEYAKQVIGKIFYYTPTESGIVLADATGLKQELKAYLAADVPAPTPNKTESVEITPAEETLSSLPAGDEPLDQEPVVDDLLLNEMAKLDTAVTTPAQTNPSSKA